MPAQPQREHWSAQASCRTGKGLACRERIPRGRLAWHLLVKLHREHWPARSGAYAPQLGTLLLMKSFAAGGPLRHTDAPQCKQEASLAECASLAAAGDLFKSPNVAGTVESADHVHHRGVEDGDCAGTRMSDWPSIFPRSLVPCTGQLKVGWCSVVGLTSAHGESRQQAGPCGTPPFSSTSEASLAVCASSGAA